MRTAAFAIALLMSGAAIAQSYDTTTTTTTTTQPDVDVDADVGIQPDGDLDVDADVDVDTDTEKVTTTTVHDSMNHNMATTTTVASLTPASGAVVPPSNADPEHDARGIAVISDPAVVPAGWNGVAGTAMGGPLVDPATGETIDAAESYPACTATVTDNCLQTYERGRKAQ
jgi:hypothetical protein